VDVIKPIDLSPETIFLALARRDRPIMCSLEGLMHVAKDSPTGQGKTSLSYAEMVMLLWMQTQIIIANPHFIPVDKKGRDWRPIGRAIEQQGWIEVAPKRWLPGLVRRPEHIATLMCWLATQEIDRRFTLQEQGDFSYKPLYLFIDEWPMIVRKCPEVADYQIEICDFPHILATFVKDIVAEPLVQKPVESKQVLNKCVGYCGSDSNGCSISWQ
jgi:hypothetical protein